MFHACEQCGSGEIETAQSRSRLCCWPIRRVPKSHVFRVNALMFLFCFRLNPGEVGVKPGTRDI